MAEHPDELRAMRQASTAAAPAFDRNRQAECMLRVLENVVSGRPVLASLAPDGPRGPAPT